jgi:hypothetical protein
MSLDTLIALDQFTGNGSTVIFDMNSKYYNDSDVVVVLTDAAGVDTIQTITTHYALSRKAEDAHDATKGRVTMVTAPAGGGTPELLTIYKKPALTQLLTLLTTGGWYSLEVEEQFDLIIMIAQDFQLQLDRTAKYAYTNLSTPSSLETLEAATGLGSLNDLVAKSVLVGDDIGLLADFAASFANKKFTMADLLVYILSNFVASSAGAGDAGKGVKLDGSGLLDSTMLPSITDTDAIHDNVGGEINAIAEKVTPVSADILIIEDSVDSNKKKKLQIGNFPGGWVGTATSDLDMNGYDIRLVPGNFIKNNSSHRVLSTVNNGWDNGYFEMAPASSSLMQGAPHMRSSTGWVSVGPKLVLGSAGVGLGDLYAWDAHGIKSASTSAAERDKFLIRFQLIGNAVNYLDITNAGTGSAPIIEATGSDSNVNLSLKVKGTAAVDMSTGGVIRNHASKSGAYTTTLGDGIIGVDSSGGAVTISLGTATAVQGFSISIQDEGGAAGTNTITIDTEGAELVNGAASVTITTNYAKLDVYSDGTNFFAG